MKTPKIDFVITWVDGSDPVWDMQRQETLRKQGIFVDESLDNSTARYRDWDILKYWFRGVETFAPWVNQIHFIIRNNWFYFIRNFQQSFSGRFF